MVSSTEPIDDPSKEALILYVFFINHCHLYFIGEHFIRLFTNELTGGVLEGSIDLGRFRRQRPFHVHGNNKAWKKNVASHVNNNKGLMVCRILFLCVKIIRVFIIPWLPIMEMMK
jgi:hypothetical protein